MILITNTPHIAGGVSINLNSSVLTESKRQEDFMKLFSKMMNFMGFSGDDEPKEPVELDWNTIKTKKMLKLKVKICL